MLIPLILLLLIYYLYEQRIVRNSLIVLFSLYVVSMIIFRYGIGTDYFAYKDIYLSMTKTDFSATKAGYPTLETSFIFIMMIAKNLNINYQTFVSILSIFMFTSYLIFQRNYLTGKSIVLSTMLYFSMFFIVWTLSAFRQGLALSVILLTVFNVKLKLKLHQRILFVLLASLIHISSLIVIVYLLLEEIFKSKKSIYLLLSFSLIISLSIIVITPYLLKVEFLRNITYINKILFYFRNSSVSYSALVVRLSILAFLLKLYDWFENGDKDIFKLYRYVVIGIAIYIAFAQAPIAASRFTIYSYILLPVILTSSVGYFENMKYKTCTNMMNVYKLITITGLILFNLVFLTKESNAFSAQARYEESALLKGYPTIFNKNPKKFKTQFGLNELVRINSDKIFDSFSINNSTYAFENGDKFISVPMYMKNGGSRNTYFAIINQNGILAYDKELLIQPQIFGEVYGQYLQGDGMFNYGYTSINPDSKYNVTDYINHIKSIETDIEMQNVTEVYTENIEKNTYNNVAEFLERIGVSEFTIDSKSTYTLPFEYSKVIVDIYKSKYAIILDQNDKVISKSLYDRIGKYDANGFILSDVNSQTHVYNQYGELIWVYK